MVLQKQLHECQNQCIQKGWNEAYRFGFPFASHIEPNFFYSKEKIDGNFVDHNMKIKMSFHIIQHCYYYGVLIWIFTYHIFLLIILFIKICHEVWSTWINNLNIKNVEHLGLKYDQI
jgi:hypothetical protein